MTLVLGKVVAVWALLVVLAIGNGFIREKWLIAALGSSAAQPVSGLVLSLLILVLAWLTVPWFGNLSRPWYWLIGTIWLLFTVVFEFAFGYFIVGDSWRELLQAYDLTTGNLWVVVLVVTAVAPYLAAAARGRT